MTSTTALPPRSAAPSRDATDYPTEPAARGFESHSSIAMPSRPTSVYYQAPHPQPHAEFRASARIDQMRYWVGVAITAVVAALATVVGLVAAQIAHVSVLLPADGTLTPAHAATFGLAAAGVTLVGGALYAAMLRVAPRPTVYYSWLVGLLTVLAVLVPFTIGAHLASAIALACINLVIGLVVMSLVPIAADNARSNG